MRLLPWLAPIAVIALELPFIWTVPHVGEWFVFWYVGHVVANGASPYDPATWVSATTDYGPVAHGIAINTANGLDVETIRCCSRWIWPPFVGLVLAPFGLLPLEAGVPLLHLATIALAIVATIALVRVLAPADMRPFVTALLFASPSLVQPMRAATMTILVLPGLALLFASLRRPASVRLALSGMLISARPQAFLVLLPPVAWLLSRSGLRRSLAVGAGIFGAVNIVAFALSPVPPDPTLLESTRAFTLHDNSSTWRLAYEIAPGGVLPVAATLIVVALALGVMSVRGATPDERDDVLLAATLAFAVALVPYTHTYDHLALFPVWIVALRRCAGADAARRVAIAGAVVVAALGYAWIAYLVGAAGTRAAVAVTPYLALAILALSGRVTSRTAMAIAAA